MAKGFISRLLSGWEIPKVKKYVALERISPIVWSLIVPTFEIVGTIRRDDVGATKVPTGTFSERLLRNILDLTETHQKQIQGELSTSSMARAIKRLYEIRGTDGQGNRGDLTSATVSEVAKEVGKSEKTVQRLRTIADLIPELSAMLDDPGNGCRNCLTA